MRTNQKARLRNAAILMLCCLLSGWLFSLPIPEFNPSNRYLSEEVSLILESSGTRQLKSNDVGITSTAARFNAVPELREVVQQERATLSSLFFYKNFILFHTRLFYNSLGFINHRYFIHPPGFFILFCKLRL